jgi:mannose-1-phosphate guanylyltransferase
MSRRSLPKQFQRLLNEETPFQHMVRLTTQVVPIGQVRIMAVPDFKDIILEQIPELTPEQILFEPSLRDNGPAVSLGFLHCVKEDPEAVVASLWSDHLVLNEAAFKEVLTAAFEAAEANPDALVDVGIKPTKPDPSLGYIHMDGSAGTFNGIEAHKVIQFIEKPDQEHANQYFRSWDYLWNAGYNVMRAASYVQQLKEVQPEHRATIEALEKAVAEGNTTSLSEAYEQMPKLAIDYLFVQKISKIIVIPGDIGWSDIGTWATLHQMLVTKSDKNMVVQGDVQSVSSENCLVYSKDRPIALVGAKDLIVVDTGDTILVMHQSAPAADLKRLVQETLSETNPELL